ncbi:hypothetical protein HUW51_24090 [Adhaeribacter swui]|uniref:STAS/SEC14 domain-containing protein n=1 Tax=Adhaeribacter swui TaxID=2086471 RepID=A0A7G7GEQ3_9BACT|nr:hypothetical protein [Adhaeribacter swui]QNF35637.1 hypothetical protein HUW51_24090 [Adhaeribacter swui]
MELQTILSTDSAVIQVNLASSYIELEWLTHPSSQVFREVIIQAQTYAQEHHLTKWLCNIQQADFIESEDQKWLVKHVFTAFDPVLHHNYAYIIQPRVSEVVSAYHIHDLVELDANLQSRIKVAIFVDIDHALQWLFAPISQNEPFS